jgi:hypothetical protein
MESIDYDGLMQANAVRVFSERDPARRLDADVKANAGGSLDSNSVTASLMAASPSKTP